ncbi:nucleoside hydrolase [Pseudoroseicyclus aestuarii]|uniref:Purine nucleosidase/non-specific riboncleoside hydrolase n=1 Tax=Pseudoroseicyclus aestuarii TaxID=1795041 RepID=A0A318SYD6_9RHOB|nr:nucleoside hydrolase [Pseudoroseicyclus aestuarii]PYE85366.1 purine nucleosidase/non-specific riboncleoside hydrolase [Pseudoroseicyclus aestuarii]
MNPLILDTDGGVDDAQALLMLIAAGRVPEAVTTCFGNVGLAAATRNILTVLAVAGCDVPVHAGQERPLTAPLIDATYIHGEDGLGGAPRPAEIGQGASDDAVGFLRRRLREAARDGQPVDILAIGPLTNIALALRLEPGIAAGIGMLTIMGGTLWGRGNTTAAAEFNVYADPEAAAIVFQADVATTVVPWEPCVAHALEGPEVDALFDGDAQDDYHAFSLALAQHARRTTVGYGGPDVFRFVDPFAAAVVIDPDIITASIEASVDVALAPGLARGMTLVDPTGRLGTPPVRLVETGDMAKLTELFARSIRWRP